MSMIWDQACGMVREEGRGASRYWARQLVPIPSCSPTLMGDWKEENRLWEAVGWVPDAQCVWADPRAVCRATVSPPHQDHASQPVSNVFCRSRRWNAEGNEDHLGNATQQDVAERIATLPMRLGGLGLRFADKMAPAAYWAPLADAMPMLSRRLPELTTHIIDEMAREP